MKIHNNNNKLFLFVNESVDFNIIKEKYML